MPVGVLIGFANLLDKFLLVLNKLELGIQVVQFLLLLVLVLELLLNAEFTLVQSAESIDLVLVLATDLDLVARCLLVLSA